MCARVCAGVCFKVSDRDKVCMCVRLSLHWRVRVRERVCAGVCGCMFQSE